MTNEEAIITVSKGTLKLRTGRFVVYDADWLKKHWQTELKVMGIECEDCISRRAVLSEILHVYEYEYPTATGAFDEFVTKIIPSIINNLPSVQPEQRMGQWVEKIVRGSKALYCSACGNGTDVLYEYDYCPNCGAKMEEGE